MFAKNKIMFTFAFDIKSGTIMQSSRLCVCTIANRLREEGGSMEVFM